MNSMKAANEDYLMKLEEIKQFKCLKLIVKVLDNEVLFGIYGGFWPELSGNIFC